MPVEMTASEVQRNINELESLRRQERVWRWVGTGAVGITAVVCVATLASSVRGLTQAGPTQEAFVSRFSGNMQTQILPDVQNLAATTFTEIRPDVEAEFSKINGRVPEMTEASMKEMETLQKNIPERGQHVLASTLGSMMEKKEGKIREMFPNATEENVHKLMQNVVEQGTQQAVLSHDELFGRHMASIENIVTDMEKIRLAEKPQVGTEQSSWEMGLLVFDVVREDLKSMEPGKAGKSMATLASTPGRSPKVSVAADAAKL